MMNLAKLCLSVSAAATSLVLLSSGFFSAEAYQVWLNGRTGGTLNTPLLDIELNGANDVGRQLDPTTWLIPEGSSNGSETTPIALSAQGVMKVLGFTSDRLSLQVTLTNNTATPDSRYRADIVSFGFGVSPDARRVTLSQSGNVVMDNAIVQSGQQNFPGGFKNIDICVFAGRTCSGGSNEGLGAGMSDTFVLDIYGNFGAQPSVVLRDMALKFQTDNGSYEAAGVPEPFTILGSGLALGAGVLLKRKQAAQQAQRSKEKALV